MVLNALNLFLYDINTKTGVVRGFVIDGEGKCTPTWSINIPETHKIVASAGKPAGEKVPDMYLIWLFVRAQVERVQLHVDATQARRIRIWIVWFKIQIASCLRTTL